MEPNEISDLNTQIQELRDKMRAFREERGWTNEDPKDMALSLVLEAAELLEYFQWKTGKEVEDEARLKGAICDELADIFWWVLAIAERLHIDVSQAFIRKMAKNAEKYPSSIFNPTMPADIRNREYYKIKARTRGGHPLAEE
jgi:NTP pyrophosphatase (non-canonical NTP hydrolase)